MNIRASFLLPVPKQEKNGLSIMAGINVSGAFWGSSWSQSEFIGDRLESFGVVRCHCPSSENIGRLLKIWLV
jgi:hypothetical protein